MYRESFFLFLAVFFLLLNFKPLSCNISKNDVCTNNVKQNAEKTNFFKKIMNDNCDRKCCIRHF